MAPRYPTPSRQPYVGVVVDNSPILTNAQLPYVGQLGPAAAARMDQWHGRRLAGLGATVSTVDAQQVATPVSSASQPNDEPDWADSSMRELEDEDDVVGSGIFDAAGRATVQADMGVFADHPSIPGFIDRNPPFTMNYEVLDVVTGGPTVEVPGGGMSYVERGGRPAPVPTLRRDGGYVQIGPSGSSGPMAAPLRNVGPGTTVARTPVQVPRLPMPAATPLPLVRAQVPSVSTVNVATGSRAIGDAGSDSSSGWGSWLFAGLILGVAGGIAYNTLGKGKRR